MGITTWNTLTFNQKKIFIIEIQTNYVEKVKLKINIHRQDHLQL